jgi:hypothetical protein
MKISIAENLRTKSYTESYADSPAKSHVKTDPYTGVLLSMSCKMYLTQCTIDFLVGFHNNNIRSLNSLIDSARQKKSRERERERAGEREREKEIERERERV